MHKVAVVTGAAGFLGFALTKTLLDKGYKVHGIVRPDSVHNERLNNIASDSLIITELDMQNYDRIPANIDDNCDLFFHIAWTGGNDVETQKNNVECTLSTIRAAKELGCKRYICTGSQAEYGVVPVDEIAEETRCPLPITAYGSAKVAACVLSRQYAKEKGIDWIWGRVFSLIGQNEPSGRMLPDLTRSLKEGKRFKLSSCAQNWDFLDVFDCAEALIALAESEKAEGIYNIANGNYRVLSDYIKETVNILGVSEELVEYGNRSVPFISLQPSVDRLMNDTGWRPRTEFSRSIEQYFIR